MMVPNIASAETKPPGKKKESGPMLRILCVSSLSENEEVLVASKTEDGKWIEYGAVTLRSSFITPWVKGAAGELHLVRRSGENLAPVCTFRIAEGAKHSVVVLLPVSKKAYRANVINPEKLGFRKGMALVTNYSKVPALVMLGKRKLEVLPGKQIAGRAIAGDDGMYRMVVGYEDEQKKLIPCYDRYIALNPEARDFLLLFPDSTTGLKVFSLSEFGPFE
jgi:hypothetical protein